MNTITPAQLRAQIESGESFTFTSHRKKGRIYTVKAIIRPQDGNLFVIRASDLKHACWLYNTDNVLTILAHALSNKPQCNFRIR